MSYEIHPERPDDAAAIDAVLRAAFPAAEEANLVKRLRIDGDLALSLVADERGTAIGHIGFVPIMLDPDPGYRVWGLAPLAVVPDRQGQGIGSALVRHGIDDAKRAGIGLILVLGNQDYYGRFGFDRMLAAELDVAWSGPHFAGLALIDGARPNAKAIYPAAFSALG